MSVNRSSCRWTAQFVAVFLLAAAAMERPNSSAWGAEPANDASKAVVGPTLAKLPSSHFVRVFERDGKPVAMQTAIARYVKPGPVGAAPLWTVDLIGAVHVGEKTYYEGLNERFKSYDALLYEFVAAGDKPAPQPQKGVNPIGWLQKGMSDTLGLVHQLDHIRYDAPNFVHADMSPAQFAQSMKDRGESVLQMAIKATAMSMEQQHKAPRKLNELSLLAAMFDPNRPLALRRLAAGDMADAELSLDWISGPDGSTIITERNKVALSKLRDQVASGKKNCGIFYGAGHFPDMDARLLADFGLQRAEVAWIDAWNLADPPADRLVQENANPATAEPTRNVN